MNEFNENNNLQEEPVEPIESVEPQSEPVSEPQEPIESAPQVDNEPKQEPDTAPQCTYTYQAPNDGFQPVGKPPKRGNVGMKIFVGLLAGFIAVCIVLGIGVTLGKRNDCDMGATPPVNPEEEYTTAQEQEISTAPGKNAYSSVTEVAQKVSPSVVGITVFSDKSDASSQASGVIMNKQGYILTNDHIYTDIPSPKFVITLHDGKSYKANYHAGDTRSDLAVLVMEDIPANITPAILGNSDFVKAGDEVVAIGSPAGLTDTVTKGIISAPSRRISSAASDSSGSGGNYTMKVIQTDTAINPGNSGGALVNMNGEVIGINSSKIVLTGYEGIGFAIPSNNAKAVFSDLTKYGKVVNRGRVGLTYTEITSSVALINNMRKGLLIRSIDTKCSLYNTNISAGDIIIGVNGKELDSEDDLLDIIESNPAGTEIELTIYLNASGKQVTHKVVLLEDENQTSYSTYQPTTTYKDPFSFDFDFGY